MSIDNSMFSDYLSSISNNIKNSGSDVEIELMNINSNLEKANTMLERISQEMLISNLPAELRKDQRNMFELIKMNDQLIYLIQRYESLIEKNPDDVATDGFKQDVAKWKTMMTDNLTEMVKLINKGCVK